MVDEQITALSSSGYDVGITREGGDDSLFRFVDAEAKDLIREGIDACYSPSGIFQPPFQGLACAKAARLVKGLISIISELAERLAMNESYVESATAARQDLPEIPGLAFGDYVPNGLPLNARGKDK